MTGAVVATRHQLARLEQWATATSRRDFVWIGLGTAALTAIDLGRRILATNDEARFAMIAQDVLTRGDWLFPRLNGVPYYNKPVLCDQLVDRDRAKILMRARLGYRSVALVRYVPL